MGGKLACGCQTLPPCAGQHGSAFAADSGTAAAPAFGCCSACWPGLCYGRGCPVYCHVSTLLLRMTCCTTRASVQGFETLESPRKTRRRLEELDTYTECTRNRAASSVCLNVEQFHGSGWSRICEDCMCSAAFGLRTEQLPLCPTDTVVTWWAGPSVPTMSCLPPWISRLHNVTFIPGRLDYFCQWKLSMRCCVKV
jgi:hypothetical protein